MSGEFTIACKDSTGRNYYININFFCFFPSDMASSKRLNRSQVDEIYKKSYREKFDWPSMLEDSTFRYLSLVSKAYNCPITLSVAGFLSLCACICGPTTSFAYTISIGNIC